MYLNKNFSQVWVFFTEDLLNVPDPAFFHLNIIGGGQRVGIGVGQIGGYPNILTIDVDLSEADFESLTIDPGSGMQFSNVGLSDAAGTYAISGGS